MSFFDHEKTAHRVAAQYLTGAVERQAAFSMDMFARLSILEGAAGVPPGKWLRKGARGFGDALEHFGSHLAAAWTTTRNEGVYDKALAAASRILGSTAMDPSDLVQDLVVNSTTTTGPDRSRMFYTVGKKLSSHANDLGSGKILPRDSKILGTLERWVRRAGIDKLKELKNRATTSFAPNTPEGFDPTRTMSVTDLDAEKRQGLLLLALQSPGGPGQELRRIIDRLVDQSFGKVARPIVRVFLQKIGEPKYRSATSMRRLLTEFKPSKWMKQAVNLVRKEMMAEMGVDSNTLTRVLGSSGRNIFKFMREKVGRDSTVKRILTELAQEIDLLEPGIARVADEREYELTEEQTPLEPHEVMVEWLRQSEQDSDEKDAGNSLPNQHGDPDLLGDIFEMNEYMDWDAGTGSQGIYTRGPVELRVGTYQKNKHMLYELTKTAFVRTELRADLVPLVRLAHAARVASHGLDLRGILIRTAYASTNPDLRRVLVAAVVAADKGVPAQIMKHADARAPRKGEYRQAFLRWVNNQKFRNPNPDGRKDSNGQPMDVSFFTLPPPEQSRIYQEWQQGRLDWAQRHKPEGLSEESRITVENFGDLKVGDVVWRSDSPVKLHRITKVDLARPNSPRLTMVQFNRENPAVEGDDRHLSPGAVKNPMLEYHRVPDMGPRADRKRAIARLPQQPRGGWPKFDDLGVGARREEKLQDAFRGMVDVRDPKELSLARVKDRLENALGESPPPRKAVKEFLHNLRDWASELAKAAKEQGDVLGPQHRMYGAMVVKLDQGIAKLEGKDRKERREKKETKSRLTPDMSMLKPHPNRPWDDKLRGKLQKVFGQAFDQVSKGAEVAPDFIEKVLKKAKDAGIDTSGQGGAQILHVMSQMARQVAAQEGIRSHEKRDLNQAAVQIAGQATKLLHRFHDEKREKEEEKAKRKEEPKRHENRKKLQGGGRKQMDAVAKLNAHFIKLVLPDNLSDEAKVVAKEQLKKAKYGDLEKMRRAAAWLADNWEDDRAKEHPLVKNMGFDREGLQKLQKLMKRKLGDVNGRQYHQDVLDMSNKHDLESEDADALYDFRIDKPTRGRALSDQEKMSRFLAKAKPETKERMQGMSVQDFMVMYNAILQEVLEDEEDLAAAA